MHMQSFNELFQTYWKFAHRKEYIDGWMLGVWTYREKQHRHVAGYKNKSIKNYQKPY